MNMRAVAVSIIVALLSAATPSAVFARASGYVNPHYHWVETYTHGDGRSVPGAFPDEFQRYQVRQLLHSRQRQPPHRRAGNKAGLLTAAAAPASDRSRWCVTLGLGQWLAHRLRPNLREDRSQRLNAR